MGDTRYSKVQFPGGVNVNNFTGMQNGHPSTPGSPPPYDYRTNAPDASDSDVANFVSDTLSAPSLTANHDPDEFVSERVVMINGDKLVGGYDGVWKGWFRDSNYTNELTPRNRLQITLGDPSTYGNIEPSENADGVRVINLYAKVEVELEM